MAKKIVRLIIVFLLIVAVLCAFSDVRGDMERYQEEKNTVATPSNRDEKSIIRAEDLENNEVEVRNYYYRQLNDFEKLIYEALVDGRDNFLNNERIDIVRFHNMDDITGYEYFVERAWKAYLYDYPLASIYAAKVQTGVEAKKVFNRETNEIIIEYYMLYVDVPDGDETYSEFDTAERTLQALKDTELVAIKFTRELEGTDEEKLRAIHDFLITDGRYDETLTKPNIRNPYGALINRNAVCAGYSYAFKYLCDLAGIKCLYVVGEGDNGISSGTHAWNHVYLDGEWKLVDITFDLNPSLTIVQTEKTEDVNNGNFSESTTYQFVYEDYASFFMVSIDNEIKIGRHVPDGNFNYW